MQAFTKKDWVISVNISSWLLRRLAGDLLEIEKFDIGKPFDIILWNRIITNKPYMKFLLMLNKIKECFVTPRLGFA
jgi:hypothetical protein